LVLLLLLLMLQRHLLLMMHMLLMLLTKLMLADMWTMWMMMSVRCVWTMTTWITTYTMVVGIEANRLWWLLTLCIGSMKVWIPVRNYMCLRWPGWVLLLTLGWATRLLLLLRGMTGSEFTDQGRIGTV